ncbi:hypothetical protein F4820DRAFT_22918 [Hypoxylon rubiginosum]|uniref:Uncharacterized protein n=1 Tax=Hypoxylon rubiginosum TaxID=110542 RepID=A0ACB9YTY4_9PEZI|nr:hypothetical protein F4820DRAFT_22918 [Hypoxylon rubiginosum]
MGNTVSSVLKGLIGDTDDDKIVKDTLNSLYQLGLSRTQTVVAEATSVQNTAYISFSKVLFQKQQIICNTSTDADSIVDGIKDAVSNLIEGQILDGVTDIIRNGLKIVLGSTSGQIASEHTYAIIATELGALLRIDTDVYNFETTSEKLTKTAKSVTAVTAVISSVDASKLTASDIRAIVSLTYSASSIQKQSDILKLVMSAWEEDRKGNLDSAGLSLSGEALERFRSHIVPSEYEGSSPVSRHLQPLSEVLTIRKKPALPYYKGSKGSTKGNSLEHGNEKRDYGRQRGSSEEPIPITILVTLCQPVDGWWIEHLSAAFSSYKVPDVLEYVGVVNGTDGNVISYQYNVVDPEMFNDCRIYSKSVIIPEVTLGIGAYISEVSSFHLQYQVPGNGDNLGAIAITYDNPVTNNTPRPVTFHSSAPYTERLTIQPNETRTLNGIILYISSGKGIARWVTYSTPSALPSPGAAINMQTWNGGGPYGGCEMRFMQDGQQHSIKYVSD